jgi:hypothetical protein
MVFAIKPHEDHPPLLQLLSFSLCLTHEGHWAISRPLTPCRRFALPLTRFSSYFVGEKEGQTRHYFLKEGCRNGSKE